MPTKATSSQRATVAATQYAPRSRPQPPGHGLAARYADVLYRPVPPIDCDDGGYPFRDHAPVEGTKHDRVRAYLGTVMRERFRLRPDVCVGSDLGLFFEHGNRAALLAPDLLIAFGAKGRGDRLSYKIWEEGKAPDLCLEVLSRETWRRDVDVKPGLYQDLGVREYWVLDTLGKLPTPIVGARLEPDGYVEITREPSGGYMSDVLELELAIVNDEFRFRDPLTGEVAPDYAEVRLAQREAERRASAAEAELAALRENLTQERGSD